MEPPGGLPPDRDRQLVLHPQQQHEQQLAKPNFTLNLTQQQQHLSSQATTPASVAAAAGVNHALASAAAVGGNATTCSGTSNISTTSATLVPALASTATAISGTTAAATAFSGTSIAHHHITHQTHPHQTPNQSQQHFHPPHNSNSASLLGGLISSSSSGGGNTGSHPQQTIEKLSRPLAFDKMEALVREMQDPDNGVPVRQQKMFLTSIPYAFMGYDLIEWLMDRLLIEESEALNIANQLCLHGYFFPVNDTKTLVVKDDSSLYRFQTPYYWPWQHKTPDNVEYAIYLAKRSLRNKQRHALEDYEAEALTSLHKNLKGKWDFISMQAEEQVRLAKERKKGDKIVGDSQERAYWRVHRPPPGQFTPLEPCPVPSRDRQGSKPNKKKSVDDVQREVDYLKKSLNRTRMKMSQACESLVNYSETFVEYDFFLQPVLPSNPWVTEDIAFWQLNNTFVDVPTEKRVKRWAISIEELVCDPTGLQEFTTFLEKEYSHENIRFWTAVNRLRRSAHSQVSHKVTEIYEEFLKPGAPCEINIDGKTMESVLKGLNNPSRFTFDSASEHIYMLLLKKDCYPRFIRSEHYKRLLECGIQPSHKKRFFNFGGVSGAKKKMTAALSSQPNMGEGSASSGKSGAVVSAMMQAPPPGSLARRRGSDRSLTGSAHELAVIGVNKDAPNKVPHSHSQSNLSEMPYRGDMPTRMVAMNAGGIYATYGARDICLQKATQETSKPKVAARLETTVESTGSAVCPWDLPDEPTETINSTSKAQVQLSVCPWEHDSGETSPAVAVAKSATQRLTSTSSDISEVSERLQRSLGIRHQNTVDSGEASMKRLMPNFNEQRRASVSFTPSRIEYQLGHSAVSSKTSSTPSPTVGSQIVVDTSFPPLYIPLAKSTTITKDPPSTSDAEVEEALSKLTLSEPVELPVTQPSPVVTVPPAARTPTATPPTTMLTPPPISETLNSVTDQPTGDLQADSPLALLSQTESQVETEQEIKELQIELIETGCFVDPSARSPQSTAVSSKSAIATPTISVHECLELVSAELASSNSNSNSTSPKSVQQEVSDGVAPPEEAVSSMQVSHSGSLEIAKVCEAATRSIPPPLPDTGPMDEEMLTDDDVYAAQEELSPTTDEYQEGLQFGADSKDVYDYDIVDTDHQTGYIAPAPTPAPTMAPLAELDVDTVEDESLDEPETEAAVVPTSMPDMATMAATVTAEEVKKRRKKRNSDGKKTTSIEEKEKAVVGEDGSAKTDADRNTVCPWEDENVSTSDGTFVKTYATLGYL